MPKKYRRVLIAGTFNTLHLGNLWLLAKAREMSKCLMLILTNDGNNKKWYARPFRERAADIEVTGLVDIIVEGKKKDKDYWVRQFKPNLIVLGYNQKLPQNIPNCKVIRMPRHGGYSTRRYYMEQLKRLFSNNSIDLQTSHP